MESACQFQKGSRVSQFPPRDTADKQAWERIWSELEREWEELGVRKVPSYRKVWPMLLLMIVCGIAALVCTEMSTQMCVRYHSVCRDSDRSLSVPIHPRIGHAGMDYYGIDIIHTGSYWFRRHHKPHDFEVGVGSRSLGA